MTLFRVDVLVEDDRRLRAVPRVLSYLISFSSRSSRGFWCRIISHFTSRLRRLKACEEDATRRGKESLRKPKWAKDVQMWRDSRVQISISPLNVVNVSSRTILPRLEQTLLYLLDIIYGTRVAEQQTILSVVPSQALLTRSFHFNVPGNGLIQEDGLISHTKRTKIADFSQNL